MSQKLDLERVAMILVEAIYYGDRTTARRWGITTRTIRNYKNQLSEDTRLSAFFLDKRKEFEENWAEEIPGVVRASLQFINQAAQKADPKAPAAIDAMANALKVVAEIGLTKELLDVKLGRFDLPDRTEDR